MRTKCLMNVVKFNHYLISIKIWGSISGIRNRWIVLLVAGSSLSTCRITRLPSRLIFTLTHSESPIFINMLSFTGPFGLKNYPYILIIFKICDCSSYAYSNYQL
ncbi:hypothetical protein BpHYR1_007708, partial [Brachionus plicatilis]